jgi:hypothetical protein
MNHVYSINIVFFDTCVTLLFCVLLIVIPQICLIKLNLKVFGRKLVNSPSSI